MGESFRPEAPVDPTNSRRQIMLDQDWSHRGVTIAVLLHDDPTAAAVWRRHGFLLQR